jgi:glyceraldehyde-3-phosphate dehydrogenase (NADP+)
LSQSFLEVIVVKNFIAGSWIDKPKKIEVRNPFDNSVIDTVPRADAGDLERALAYAERGAKVMAKLSSYERWKI